MTGGRAWAGEWREIKAPGRIQRVPEAGGLLCPRRLCQTGCCLLPELWMELLEARCWKTGGTCIHRCPRISQERLRIFAASWFLLLYFFQSVLIIYRAERICSRFTACWRKRSVEYDGCMERIRVYKPHGCFCFFPQDGWNGPSVVLVNTLVLDLPIWRNCAISDFVGAVSKVEWSPCHSYCCAAPKNPSASSKPVCSSDSEIIAAGCLRRSEALPPFLVIPLSSVSLLKHKE